MCGFDWVALGSFIVAAVALWRTYKKDMGEKIRKSKAVIRAKGYKSGKDWKVRIWNDGAATAKNIRFIPKIGNDDGITLIYDEEQFPYPILNSGDDFEIGAALWGTPNPTPLVKFMWDDEYGKDNMREQVLEF
jgi:hypothetical protein